MNYTSLMENNSGKTERGNKMKYICKQCKKELKVHTVVDLRYLGYPAKDFYFYCATGCKDQYGMTLEFIKRIEL